jgi:RNA-directed DNA polymerase
MRASSANSCCLSGENNGKKTPGVDQEIWDTPEKKTQAAHALKRRGYQSQTLRRVYIPKSDGKTMRPLGIPTMIDRGQQALHLLALDPVVETIAERNSYGFRQKRSCADAMEQCFKALRSANTQWILEGDIRSCFDKIFARLAFGSCPDGSSHSPKVAEIRVHQLTVPS